MPLRHLIEAANLNLTFWFISTKNKGWNVWIILRTRTQYTVRSVEASAHPGWQDEAELKSEKSICNWSFYQREREKGTEREREREREREIEWMRSSDREIETELETERETERQRGRERKRERERERERERGTNRKKDSATAKKSFSKLTNLTVFCASVLKELWVAEVKIHRNLFWWIEQWNVFIVTDNTKKFMTKILPFQTLWSPFAWEIWTGRKNFEIVQPVHYHSQRVQTFLFSKCSINHPPIADGLLPLKSLLIGIHCVDVNFIGRVVPQSVQRPSKTVRVLRNNVFCHLANNICVFGVLPCASFWHFSNGAYFLERRITMCSEQVGNV